MKSKVLLVILFLILNSCSSINSKNIAPGYVQAYSAIKDSIFGSDNKIDLEYIKKIPYASMLVKIGKGPTGLMILESQSDDKYTWVSADGVYLVIQNGKIIKSYGLPNNLEEKIDSFTGWNSGLEDPKQEYISYNSYDKPELRNLKITSTYNFPGTQEINLQLRILDLNLIEETINAKRVGWKKINRYWIDQEGFVWKSKQNISPRLPEIVFTVTKKPQ